MRFNILICLVVFIAIKPLVAAHLGYFEDTLAALEERDARSKFRPAPDFIIQQLIEDSLELKQKGSLEARQEDYCRWVQALIENKCSVEHFLVVHPHALAFGPSVAALHVDDRDRTYRTLLESMSTFVVDINEANLSDDVLETRISQEVSEFITSFPLVAENHGAEERHAREVLDIRNSQEEITNLLGKRNRDDEVEAGHATQRTTPEPAPKRNNKERWLHLVNQVAQAYNEDTQYSARRFRNFCIKESNFGISNTYELFELLMEAKANGLIIPHDDGFLFRNYEQAMRFKTGELIKDKQPMEAFIKLLPEEFQRKTNAVALTWSYLFDQVKKGKWHISNAETEYLKTLHKETDLTQKGKQVVDFLEAYVAETYDDKNPMVTELDMSPADLYEKFLASDFSKQQDGTKRLAKNTFMSDIRKLRANKCLGLHKASDEVISFVRLKVKSTSSIAKHRSNWGRRYRK